MIAEVELRDIARIFVNFLLDSNPQAVPGMAAFWQTVVLLII
jgi:hypothetical protein